MKKRLMRVAAMFAIVFGIFWGIGYALDALSHRPFDPATEE